MNDFIFLSHWTGRFGNRMHQYAFGATYSRINNVQFTLCSDWEGTILFANLPHFLFPDDGLRVRMNQIRNRHREKYREEVIRQYEERMGIGLHYLRPDVDDAPYLHYDYSYYNGLCAYNSKIFSAMSKEHLREIFSFSDEVKELPIFKKLADIQGTYDVAHLRRDDISNPGAAKCGYSVLSIDSYKRAFEKYGFDADCIQWVSDDYTNQWANKLGFNVNRDRLGWSYPLGSNYSPEVVFDWLEDFLKLYFARTIFRANSSFSWWAGMLSPTAKVFSPRLSERRLYNDESLEELDVQFEEGNHPHWVNLQGSKCPDITIPE